MRPSFKKKFSVKEFFIEWALRLAAFTSVLATLGIVWILSTESIPFFREVSLTRFLTEKDWMPLFAEARFGILPLVCGTLVTTVIALTVAVPAGLIVATYLSEYAHSRAREVLKPILELLSAVPTVVYGYFALLFVTPLLQKVFVDLPGFNMLSAGVVMGIMIIPYVSSLSEDAMQAVPMSLREGAYALGSTRFQTARRVVFPAAFSGITSAMVLALSRAVGETMIVTIAAGMQPTLTLNPMNSAETLTAYIVQVSLGDMPHGSLGYQTLFAVGLTLSMMTLGFNVVGHLLRRRFREVYE